MKKTKRPKKNFSNKRNEFFLFYKKTIKLDIPWKHLCSWFSNILNLVFYISVLLESVMCAHNNCASFTKWVTVKRKSFPNPNEKADYSRKSISEENRFARKIVSIYRTNKAKEKQLTIWRLLNKLIKIWSTSAVGATENHTLWLLERGIWKNYCMYSLSSHPFHFSLCICCICFVFVFKLIQIDYVFFVDHEHQIDCSCYWLKFSLFD